MSFLGEFSCLSIKKMRRCPAVELARCLEDDRSFWGDFVGCGCLLAFYIFSEHASACEDWGGGSIQHCLEGGIGEVGHQADVASGYF